MNANQQGRSVSASNPNTHTNSNPTGTDNGVSDVLRQWLDSKPATAAETFSPASLSLVTGSRICRMIAAFEGTAQAEGRTRADIVEDDGAGLEMACISTVRLLAEAALHANEQGEHTTESHSGMADALLLVADVMEFRRALVRSSFNAQPVTALR